MKQLLVFVVFLVSKTLAHGDQHEYPTCTPCTQEEIDQCPPVVESPTCEVVHEPNCGCCGMCAKTEGQNCGVGLGYCGTGLKCFPLPGRHPTKVRDIILENQLGKFVCFSKDFQEETDADKILSDAEFDALYEPLNPPLRSGNPRHIPRPPYPSHKQPCFDHNDDVWVRKYFARHDWIPDCRQDGKYFPLQCETTFGLVRGRCWCVNKSGKRRGGYVSQPFASLCDRRKRHRS